MIPINNMTKNVMNKNNLASGIIILYARWKSVLSSRFQIIQPILAKLMALLNICQGVTSFGVSTQVLNNQLITYYLPFCYLLRI